MPKHSIACRLHKLAIFEEHTVVIGNLPVLKACAGEIYRNNQHVASIHTSYVDTRAPRTSFGAISPMYWGDTTADAPI